MWLLMLLSVCTEYLNYKQQNVAFAVIKQMLSCGAILS